MNYIAHIRDSDDEIQTAYQHAKGVSDRCAECAGAIGFSSMGRLMGFLHDMGKSKQEFAGYIEYTHAHPDDLSRRGSVNHSAAGARYLYERFGDSKDPIERLAAQMLAQAVCSHHHRSVIDTIDPEGEDIFRKRIYPEREIGYEESVNNFLQECGQDFPIDQLFREGVAELRRVLAIIKAEQLPLRFMLHLIMKYLFSCLLEADRSDTELFMQNRLPEKEPELPALWKELTEKLDARLEGFPRNSRIGRLRHKISESCRAFGDRETGIYRLCVPTGGGKTFGSLRAALLHAEQTGKRRIFYIIPYISILDQNAKEIRDALQNDAVILEHHSDIIIEEDEEEYYRAVSQSYRIPIVLTTMVQFLNTFYAAGSQNIRRMQSFANAVIVFDEIQSLPVKCVDLFNCALNFLCFLCGTTSILCTATQPRLDRVPVRLRLAGRPDMIPDMEAQFTLIKRTKVIDKTRDGDFTPEALAGFTMDLSEDSILLILNTKSAAREVFLALEALNQELPEAQRFSLCHLSNNMCPTHRMDVLGEVREKLGGERVICVSTALIEAGVNISFRCVIRDLAGLDSVAQAAGRCNRHGESAAPGNVYIVRIKNERLGYLPDIKIGAECSEHVLHEFAADPAQFGGDLLSRRTMERYYRYYFDNRLPEMEYDIKNANTTLYKLLYNNSDAQSAYRDIHGAEPPYLMPQAFETAAARFSVIEDNTVGVIVPYAGPGHPGEPDGAELIERLSGRCDFETMNACLKAAQRYSVNIVRNGKEENGKSNIDLLVEKGYLHWIGNHTMLAVDKSCYDPRFGLDFKQYRMEFLDY